MLVEDDSALRYLYSKMNVWEQYGFEITEQVSNGKEALKLLETKQFDLFITDIRMPLVDGLTLLREVKEKNIEVLPVLASAHDKFEYARAGIVLGAFDFLVKPVTEAKVATVLERDRKSVV